MAAIPEYADGFVATYDHIEEPAQITFADISNAIAAFMAFEWRSDTSPFDAVLRGEATLPEPAATGMALLPFDAVAVTPVLVHFFQDGAGFENGIEGISRRQAWRLQKVDT